MQSVVSEPRPAKICAISTAMYPAPTTTTLPGRDSSSKKPSLVMPRSAPGRSGSRGRPPTAIRMWSAVYTLPPTSTRFSPTNLAAPLMISTLELSRFRW